MRIVDYFRRGLQRDPARAAFVGNRGSLSYAEVSALSERIASGLAHLRACDVSIAVYSPNDPIAFAAMIGLFRAGARWVPINMRNPVAVNAALLRTTDCAVLFYHPSLAAQAAELRDAVPSLLQLVCLGERPADAPGMSLPALVDLSAARCPEPPDDAGRIETIFPTGGTTGLSKAAMWSQRTWDSAIKAFWTCLPTDGPAVHLVAAPMTHAAGVVALMMMCEATTNVILPSANATAILEAIQEHRVTHLYLPPTALYSLLAHPRVREYDYSSLRCLVLAASPVAPNKFREAMDVFGPVLCQSYGQAEAPMFVTFLSTQDLLGDPAREASARWASCGRATLGQRVQIMDEEGTALPPGVRGEIVVRGDLVFPGYYRDPAATEAVSAFGWHHTGDVGYIDDEGFVFIVDRKKDMIVTGGFNVFSAEVEQVIGGHPAVEDCAVVGVPDPKWGEAIKAIVQLRPGQDATEDEITQLVREHLGPVHVPKSVDFVTDLPRSPNGKVMKSDIRARYWQGSDRLVG